MRTIKIAAIALSVSLALTACAASPAAPPPAAPTAAATTQEPTRAPAPEPTIPEFSQEIDGVLYEGTEKAPVRIGDDTPGKAPAHQAHRTTYDKRNAAAQEANKYIVQVGKDLNGKWYWGVAGESRHGGFRGLSFSNEVHGEDVGYYPDRATALEQDIIVDGRVLDRAEYVLLIQEGMEFVYAE